MKTIFILTASFLVLLTAAAWAADAVISPNRTANIEVDGKLEACLMQFELPPAVASGRILRAKLIVDGLSEDSRFWLSPAPRAWAGESADGSWLSSARSDAIELDVRAMRWDSESGTAKFDVTRLVRAWQSGDSNHGMILQRATPGVGQDATVTTVRIEVKYAPARD